MTSASQSMYLRVFAQRRSSSSRGTYSVISMMVMIIYAPTIQPYSERGKAVKVRCCPATVRRKFRSSPSQTPPGGIYLSRERYHVHITSGVEFQRCLFAGFCFASRFQPVFAFYFRLCSRSNKASDRRRHGNADGFG